MGLKLGWLWQDLNTITVMHCCRPPIHLKISKARKRNRERERERERERSVCWRGSAGPFVILNVAVSVCNEGRINPLIQN